MQIGFYFLLSIFGLLFCAHTFAAEGDDSVSLGLAAYVQKDGPDHKGGNPRLDEDELVFEAIILFDKELSERDRLNVKVLGDIVTSASQARFHNPQFRVLQSNPSGNKHIAADVDYSHRFDTMTLGGHGGYSYETNVYMTWLYGVHVSFPLPGNNTVLGARLDAFTDFYQLKLFDGTMPGFTVRQTLSSEFNWLQVVSPLDIISLSLGYALQLGTLETSYYSVFVDTGMGSIEERREMMPTQRHRGFVSGRWKHSMSKNSTFELGYRFYGDNWKVYSHAVDLRLFQYFYQKHILTEPNLRFYTQTGAYFFKRDFTTIPLAMLPAYRSSETDLGPFQGGIFGLKISLIELPFFPVWISELSANGNYWLRDDGFMIYWFDVGYLVRF